jgi:hypothetical protein
MHAQTAMIENGFVHLPKDAAWLPEYLHELTAFPKGKHDVQPVSRTERGGARATSEAGLGAGRDRRNGGRPKGSGGVE